MRIPLDPGSRAFRLRRFANWFPLGLTYALFYMGRYNLSLAGARLKSIYHWDNATFGSVITAGMWAYAFAFLINGPLTDRLGGKRAMIIGGLGLAAINFGMSLLVGLGPFNHVHLAWTALFVACMYFQSFGAVSIVKVNASWFHIRERGTFSGIFGILISFGYQLAYGVGGLVLATLGLSYIFLVPAVSVAFFCLLDHFLIRDRPEEAGLPPLDTGDAAHADLGEGDVPFGRLLLKMARTRAIVLVALAELCTGFVRNGIMFWLPTRLTEQYRVAPPRTITLAILNPLHWDAVSIYGLGLFLTGVVGGLLAGRLSDKVFGSRRGPVAALFYVGLCGSLGLLAAVGSAGGVVLAGLCASFFFIGIHGVLSGTASMDFGGRKAAGTATGIIDGFVYLGSGIAGWPLGWALDHLGAHKWQGWPLLLLPLAVAGTALSFSLWNARPARGAQPPATALESSEMDLGRAKAAG